MNCNPNDNQAAGQPLSETSECTALSNRYLHLSRLNQRFVMTSEEELHRSDRKEHKHKHKHKERDRARDRDRDRDKERERGRDRDTGKDVDKVDAERDSSRRNDRDRDNKRDRRDRHKDQSQDTREKPADRSVDDVRQADRRSPADACDDEDRHASHVDAPEAATEPASTAAEAQPAAEIAAIKPNVQESGGEVSMSIEETNRYIHLLHYYALLQTARHLAR